MKLILMKKLLQRKKKAGKRARKRRLLHALGLCCAFCAGAAAMGCFVYTHRQALAMAVVGKDLSKRRHFCFGKGLLKLLRK